MLRVIICWNQTQMHHKLNSFAEEGYKINKSRYTATKDKERVRFLTQLSLKEHLEGYNPDIVEFECIPDQFEIDFVVHRARAKKGRVFKQGRLIYDWNWNNKTETSS